MTIDQLTDTILSVPEFAPRSLVLLRMYKAGQVEQITQIDRMRAYTEMSEVKEQAQKVFEKVSKLQPTTLESSDGPQVQGVYL
ncbi:MAG: hypothetical protein AAFQ07_07505 [Chloroflexota bacterium]